MNGGGNERTTTRTPRRVRPGFVSFLKYSGRSLVTLGAFTVALVICAWVPNQSIEFSADSAWTISPLGRTVKFSWGIPLGIVVAVIMVYAGRGLVKKSRELGHNIQRESLGSQVGVDAAELAKMLDVEVPRISKRLSGASLEILAKAVIQPSMITARVTEHVTLQDRRLLRKVHRQLSIDPQLQGRLRRHVTRKSALFVPVLRHRKQRLMDEIDIELDGVATPIVPHNANIAITLIVAEQMFESAFPSWFPEKGQIFRAIASVISYPAPVSQTAPYQALLAELLDAQKSQRPDPSQFNELRGFLKYFADYYFIYVEIDPQNPPKTVATLFSERRSSDMSGFSGFIRRTFGIPVYRYRIPVTEAVDCDTYHLRSKAPEFTYLSHAYCRVDTDPGGDITSSGIFLKSEAFFAPTYGTDTVHFYTRNLRQVPQSESGQNSTNPELYVDLDFQVTPPGLSFPILCLLVYLSILTTAIALVQQRVFTLNSSNLGRNVTALVFAVPAIMSGWVLTKLDRQGMRTVSPVALLELASTLLLSVFCVATTAIEGAAPSPPPLTHPTLGILSIYAPAHQLAWGVIWVLVTGQLLTSAAAGATRSHRFHLALKRAEREYR